MPSVAGRGRGCAGEKDRENWQEHPATVGSCCQDGRDDGNATRQKQRPSQASLAGLRALATSSPFLLAVAERQPTGQVASRGKQGNKVECHQ